MSDIAGYDLIGDIHGHADELCALLQRLGYRRSDGVFSHSERKVIYLGDLIDRGPKIREVIDIVRPMVGTGQALAIMGNHEFNALAFHASADGRKEHSLRPRSVKNIRQHAATLQQLNDDQLAQTLDWFSKLPIWMEVELPAGGRCRAVHACWDNAQIATIARALEDHAGVSIAFLTEAMNRDSPLFQAVETVLKGKELRLPTGYSYFDKEGHERTAIRARWYERPAPGACYQDYALQADPIACAIKIDDAHLSTITPYPKESPPVFLGHYWLRAERPMRLASNVACLDYSVAKGGLLCAYRWDGEAVIDDSRFLWTASFS